MKVSGKPQITCEQLGQWAQGDHCLCERWNRKKSCDPSWKVEAGKSLNGKGRNSKTALHRECWYQKKTKIAVKTGCSTEEQLLIYYNWKCATWLIERTLFPNQHCSPTGSSHARQWCCFWRSRTSGGRSMAVPSDSITSFPLSGLLRQNNLFWKPLPPEIESHSPSARIVYLLWKHQNVNTSSTKLFCQWQETNTQS